jgi:ATP-dependent DNA helicase RecQ
VLEEVARIRALDPKTRLGDIAVLSRTYEPLQAVRAQCAAEGLRCTLPPRDGAGGALQLIQSREGRRLLDALRERRAGLVRPRALLRWIGRQHVLQPANPFWSDLDAAVQELVQATPATRIPAAEVMEWIHECSAEARRDGSADALRLLTAHGAKGLEFRHVIVMDAGDWRSSSDAERRLLFVAMTRARETLTLFKAEDGRNPFLADLGTLEGVHALLPDTRSTARPELRRRFMSLGPGEVDIGYAGRFAPGHAVHRYIAALAPGSAVRVQGRCIVTLQGHTVGRVAKAAALPAGTELQATVTGILVRTRAQTPPAYLDSTRCERWEVVLIEVEGDWDAQRHCADAQG